MNHNSGVTFHPTCLAKSLRLLKEHTLLPDQRLLSWRLLQSLCLVFYDSIRANVDELDEQVWNMQLWNVLSIIQDAAQGKSLVASSCLNMRTNAACAGKQPCWASRTWVTGVCIWKSKSCQNHYSTHPLEKQTSYSIHTYIHISSIVSRKFYRYKHIYRFKTTKCSMLEEWIAGLNPDTFTLLSVRITGNPGKRRFGVVSWYV